MSTRTITRRPALSTMYITADVTWFGGGQGRHTPADAFDQGLAGLLDRVSPVLGVDGVVLVDAAAAARLGLPVDELPSGEAAKDHPTLAGVRAAGWKCREIYRWSEFVKGGRTVQLGLLGFIDPEYCPLIARWDPAKNELVRGVWPGDVVAAFDAWHALTGSTYRGDPGDAGNAMLKGLAGVKRGGRVLSPQWWANAGPDGDPVELPYTGGQWKRPGPGRWLHGFDRVRAYLAAMTTLEVPAFALRRGKRQFDPTMAGWWLVDLAPWQLAEMPDPAGYGPDLRSPASAQVRKCVTTPRLKLIDQLVAEGVHGGYEVIDAWVAKGEANIMKPYAARLREAWDAAPDVDQDLCELLRLTIKDAFRRSHGKWRSEQSDIKRRDWAALLSAQNSTTMWRHLWTAGKKAAIWPVRWETDCAYYSSDDPDPHPLGQQLGLRLVDPQRPETDKLGAYRIISKEIRS